VNPRVYPFDAPWARPLGERSQEARPGPSHAPAGERSGGRRRLTGFSGLLWAAGTRFCPEAMPNHRQFVECLTPMVFLLEGLPLPSDSFWLLGYRRGKGQASSHVIPCLGRKKGTVHPLIPQWIPMSPSVKPERRHLNADDRQLAWQHPYPNPPSSRRFNAAADETLRYSETRSSSAAVPGSDSDAFSAAAAASSRAARRRLP
jgi:hypothetical protein